MRRCGPCICARSSVAALGESMSKAISPVHISRLREVFDYREDGNLIRRRTGEPVGCVHHSGYLQFWFAGKTILLHRAIFAWHHGRWPEQHCDHIDRDKRNNRIENLRDVCPNLNGQNRGPRKNNTTGVAGVYIAPSGRYRATIRRFTKRITLGTFDTVDEAAKAIREYDVGNMAR